MADVIGLLVVGALAPEALAAGSGIAGLGTLATTTIGFGGISFSIASGIGTAVIIGTPVGRSHVLVSTANFCVLAKTQKLRGSS